MLFSFVAASSFALVIQDAAALRAAPRDSALQQTALYQGDMVEIRGSKLDYLQVYDYRRERGGYIRAQQLRPLELNPAQAADNRMVWRYLRDVPGAESLGIAYTAAYLKAAAPADIDAEAFDALGSFADRLAKRANNKPAGKSAELALAGHLESAAYYGVQIKRYERDGKAWFCYDGEAYRRVLAMRATAEQQAKAALALTRSDCINPAALETDRQAHDLWRAEVLDKVDQKELPDLLKQRLRLRKAGIWSAIAFQQARKALPYQAAGSRALQEFTGLKASELSDEDQPLYNEAALRVAASRWASLPEKLPQTAVASGLHLTAQAGAPGETCLTLRDGAAPAKAGQSNTLARRCTYGMAWMASQRVHPQNQALVLAVQTLEGWRELWLWHKVDQQWVVDVIPPANSDPDLAYVDFAGWIPGSNDKFLLAREARTDGRYQRSYEVFNRQNLQTETSSERLRNVALFSKWQDAQWQGISLMQR